jgi:hypothetical protein
VPSARAVKLLLAGSPALVTVLLLNCVALLSAS